MIKGAHYSSIEDIKIKSLKTNYTDLNKWISVNPFDVKRNIDNSNIVAKCNYEEMKTYDIKDFELKIISMYYYRK